MDPKDLDKFARLLQNLEYSIRDIKEFISDSQLGGRGGVRPAFPPAPRPRPGRDPLARGGVDPFDPGFDDLDDPYEKDPFKDFFPPPPRNRMPLHRPRATDPFPPMSKKDTSESPLPPPKPVAVDDKVLPVPPAIQEENIPGIEGTFDGVSMTASDGKQYEVPINYAAKTRLVYGDVLNMYEEDGETKFKLIQKLPRKKLNALAVKKEGKWYAIAGTGSYKISDNAAEFNTLLPDQEIQILVPEGNEKVPYAAFDKVISTPAPVQEEKPVTVSNRPAPSDTPKPANPAPQAKPKPVTDSLRVVEDFDLV